MQRQWDVRAGSRTDRKARERTFLRERRDGVGPAGDPHGFARRTLSRGAILEARMEDARGLKHEAGAGRRRACELEPDHHVCVASAGSVWASPVRMKRRSAPHGRTLLVRRHRLRGDESIRTADRRGA